MSALTIALIFTALGFGVVACIVFVSSELLGQLGPAYFFGGLFALTLAISGGIDIVRAVRNRRPRSDAA